MKKSVLLFLGLVLLAGCSNATSTSSKSKAIKEVPVTENVEAYTQTFNQQSLVEGEYSEKEVSMEDDERKAAYDALQKYKESIQDEKEILKALDIVDEFYINDNTMQHTRKAYGIKSESEIYQRQFSYLAKELGIKDKSKLTYQDKTYKAKDWGPRALKVTVNTLQQSAAYEVIFAKYDTAKKKVYLHLSVPTIDTFQYYVLATYQDNYLDFYQPLEEMSADSSLSPDERMLVKFIYYVKAVGGEEGAGRLSGMGWGVLEDLYLAFDVTKDGSIKLTDEMVGALGNVTSSKTNEELQPVFEKMETQEK